MNATEITEYIKKIETELDAFKKAPTDWQLKAEVSNLKRELHEERQKREKSNEEMKSLRDQLYHWKDTVRYMQLLKKTEKIRNIPTHNFLHRSKFKDDTWTNRERIFIKYWRKENKENKGMLRTLLSENPNSHGADITQRDAMVAATIITWLGTNCGQCFLYQVSKEISRSNIVKSEKRNKKHALR